MVHHWIDAVQPAHQVPARSTDQNLLSAFAACLVIVVVVIRDHVRPLGQRGLLVFVSPPEQGNMMILNEVLFAGKGVRFNLTLRPLLM